MTETSVPPIDFGKKKKKPKQPVIDEIVDKVADELNDASFFDKKKKKKRADAPLRLEEGDAAVEKIEAAEPSESDATAAGASVGAATPQHPALRYPYEMLLQRIFEQLIANNPELALDVKKKLKLPPPTMARVGTKKTQFTNFTTICRSFNREPSHLSAYLFAELGTTGSMDANGALVIRGKYMAKHIEPLLQNYARTYVKCSTCGSHDTSLFKDARLLFLLCKKCSSRVTVKNVTSGFQAVTDKRAAIRAKNQ